MYILYVKASHAIRVVQRESTEGIFTSLPDNHFVANLSLLISLENIILGYIHTFS